MQKKKDALLEKLIELNNYYISVCNQVGRATADVISAEAHLRTIEEKLK